MKICTKCGEEKSLTEFNKNRTQKSGITRWCRSCISIYNRAYSKRDYVKERKINYNNANKKRRQIANKKWREENKEYKREKDREYNRTHKEQRREKDKALKIKRRLKWDNMTEDDWAKQEAQLKKCPRCKDIKDLTNFYRNRNTPNGHSWICKICDSLYSPLHRNHEAAKMRFKAYYENNKEVFSQKSKIYRALNFDKIKERRYSLDSYYRNMLKKQFNLDSADIPQELIELKKVQIQLIRHLREE